MITTANSNKNKVITIIAAVVLSVASIMGLQGCSSSSDSVTVVPTQDASGLFNGLATLNTQSLDDLKGMVNANRMMLFSVTANLVIDGTLSVTNDNFTGTVKIYKNGVIADQAASVSGKVTTASSITGTITNSTVANGTFALTFDPLYNREASFAKIDATVLPFFEGTSYSVDTSATFSMEPLSLDNPSMSDSFCNYDGGPIVIPSAQTNIYLLTLITAVELSGCSIVSLNPDDYSGIFSLVDGVSVEDTLLVVMTNGTNSIFAIIDR